MVHLTDGDLFEVQQFVDRTRAALAGEGLTVRVDSDLQNWVQHMRQAPGTLSVAATYDPEYCYVHPGNSFWVIYENAAGSIVVCQAHKVIETDNIVDEVRTHRMFFDRRPILDHYPVQVAVEPETPVISGRVGYGGGLWVHPNYRGKGLSGMIARLTRNLSVRHFGIDWNVGFVADTPSRTQMGLVGYGMAHRTPLLRGRFPLYGAEKDMQMLYMSRAEMLAQMRSENRGEHACEEARLVA